MKILMTDGSGLTARQTANRLSDAGHLVDALSPDPLCLCRFTRHVQRIHRVPICGRDPFAWLDAALQIYRSHQFEMLFPTQEQVAALATVPDRLLASGVATAVPSFHSLEAVQDKVSASRTLARLGIPQPRSSIESHGWTAFPAFVKEPIGTASNGVRRVDSADDLDRATLRGGEIIQLAVEGPLAMCQSVFDHGSLVAFHANLRTGEGANGGASHKESIDLPEAKHWFEILGADLDWHGGLSADVILTEAGPAFIDINPRLVEPENGWQAGVDLVGAMVEIARGSSSVPPSGRGGVKTHQLLLAVLGAAQSGAGRRGVASELLAASRNAGLYSDSTEELTPMQGDPLASMPVAMASIATLIWPPSWSWFASGSVGNYALTPEAWDELMAEYDRRGTRQDNPLPRGTTGGSEPSVESHRNLTCRETS
jgi:ATP-grasp domain